MALLQSRQVLLVKVKLYELLAVVLVKVDRLAVAVAPAVLLIRLQQLLR